MDRLNSEAVKTKGNIEGYYNTLKIIGGYGRVSMYRTLDKEKRL